jgi:hypothetical protein
MLLLACIGAVFLASSQASATSFSSPGIQYIAYKTGETVANANTLVGPQGTSGVPGEPGPAGSTGSTGQTGQNGQTGITGLKGDQGNVGPQGTIGNTGPVGPTGPVGSNGSTGQPWQNGAVGAKGDQGNIGSQGNIGPQGNTGNTGPIGQTGQNGQNGQPGQNGQAGQQGAIGQTGPAGTNGKDGAIGQTGPAGTNGKDGAASAPISFTSNVSGSGMTGTPSVTGAYIQSGKLITFWIRAGFTGVSKMPTVGFAFTLPNGLPAISSYSFNNTALMQNGTAQLFPLVGVVNPGSSVINIFFTYVVKNATDIQLNSLTGTSLVNLTSSDYIFMSGTYMTP